MGVAEGLGTIVTVGMAAGGLGVRGKGVGDGGWGVTVGGGSVGATVAAGVQAAKAATSIRLTSTRRKRLVTFHLF